MPEKSFVTLGAGEDEDPAFCVEFALLESDCRAGTLVLVDEGVSPLSSSPSSFSSSSSGSSNKASRSSSLSCPPRNLPHSMSKPPSTLLKGGRLSAIAHIIIS